MNLRREGKAHLKMSLWPQTLHGAKQENKCKHAKVGIEFILQRRKSKTKSLSYLYCRSSQPGIHRWDSRDLNLLVKICLF
jgi:hypothetical protein